jgi:hypothetical protein
MMVDELKPNKKYSHLFAILRYEADLDPTSPIDLRVTVKKVVTDAEYAAAEVGRLNALNKEKGSYYFSQITRLEEVPAEAGDVAAFRAGAAQTHLG